MNGQRDLVDEGAESLLALDVGTGLVWVIVVVVATLSSVTDGFQESWSSSVRSKGGNMNGQRDLVDEGAESLWALDVGTGLVWVIVVVVATLSSVTDGFQESWSSLVRSKGGNMNGQRDLVDEGAESLLALDVGMGLVWVIVVVVATLSSVTDAAVTGVESAEGGRSAPKDTKYILHKRRFKIMVFSYIIIVHMFASNARCRSWSNSLYSAAPIHHSSKPSQIVLKKGWY